ncbi:hypothetical protein B0H13DRAFT_2326938 [Mycena leptocephala]|nr:hypothetical protein B0H13DRAFT_2326938 [Mycena leptocephala]
MSKRTRSQYIDDSAEVDHDTLMHEDASDDDDDSYEAQLRRQDREDFDMAAIDAGHEERLRSDAQYRIPTPLLQSGSPPGLLPPDLVLRLNAQLYPPQDDALGAQTPLFLPEREQTPLFLPGSRGPTPYDFEFRAETPTFFLPLVGPARGDSALRRLATASSPSRPHPAPPVICPPHLDQLPPSLPKKRRVDSGADAEDSPHQRRLHRFLDVSARTLTRREEEEDEETLSDKEFLDDEPVHEDPQRHRPVFPEEDETEEDLRALAAVYEDAGCEYSVRPRRAIGCPNHTLVLDTWVIPKHGLHKGRLSLVLTKRKLLAAPMSLVETVGMGLMMHQQFNKCIEVTQSTDMLREKYTVVQPPTPAQLAPFLEDDHPALEKIRFRGHSPALAKGDRVVVVAGPHQGEAGFIVVLREVPVDRQRVKYAKIVKVYNGVDIVKKGDTGLYDRVRVVSGVLFRGATGHVIDNSNGILTVVADKSLELTGATTQSEMSDRQVFQTSIRYVNRDYRCGDLVRVRTGKHKGRVGLIVATFTGGSFEVFDGDKPKPEQTEFPTIETVQSTRRDIDFATYESASLASRSSMRLGRLEAKAERTEKENVDCAILVAQIMRLNRLVRGIPSDAGSVDKVVDTKIMHTGRRYKGMAVLVTGKGMHKGFQGTVIGDQDNAARVRRLAKKRRKGEDSWRDEDQDGIVVTIRSETAIRRWRSLWTNASTDTLACRSRRPVSCLTTYLWATSPRAKGLSSRGFSGAENSTSSAYAFSAPFKRSALGINSSAALAWCIPVSCDDDGGWMCILGLSSKHFDIQVVGITGVQERMSATLLALEGRHGHILANAPIQRGTKKLDVCGVGKTGTKHAVYAQCIKPRRKDDDGRSLTEISQRVVVIGPDMGEGTSFEGCYGLTQPEVPHFYDSGVVCVQVELRENTFDTAFFAVTSLCMAKNIALTYGGQAFPATTFPE